MRAGCLPMAATLAVQCCVVDETHRQESRWMHSWRGAQAARRNVACGMYTRGYTKIEHNAGRLFWSSTTDLRCSCNSHPKRGEVGARRREAPPATVAPVTDA